MVVDRARWVMMSGWVVSGSWTVALILRQKELLVMSTRIATSASSPDWGLIVTDRVWISSEPDSISVLWGRKSASSWDNMGVVLIGD